MVLCRWFRCKCGTIGKDDEDEFVPELKCGECYMVQSQIDRGWPYIKTLWLDGSAIPINVGDSASTDGDGYSLSIQGLLNGA